MTATTHQRVPPTDRSAVVTGAAGGIGRALVEHLARQGYLVHAADLTPAAVPESRTGVRAHRLDVTDPEAVEALAREVGAVDMVCLNAGVVGPSTGPPWEAPPEEWNSVLGVNLLGVVNGLRAFIPRLLSEGRPAHLLITASLAGLLTFPGGGAYAASKHALVAVAEQTAMALDETPLTVSLLCPALVRSGMSPVGEDPADVAAEAVAAAHKGQFLVVPAAWQSAIRDRGNRLAAADHPQVPTPTDSTEE